MQNLAELGRRIRKDFSCTFGGEIADAYDPLGLENPNDVAKVFVARGEQFLALAWREFVRRTIAAVFLNKCERTIIHHDVLAEEFVGRTEPFREQSP